ncbi:Hsp20/alpha crystallin family protein [Chitinophagaceae bacterium LB-8]|uniref:Hsp20/alpha crystallin family protein n=1 Tax=Paraflavisolibacter caeni TaxID=2982496 RepID=A0A9X3BGJ3_9BACT|nr:Hsp20/alpha crystallin family protein [Paraflavisolibacter caeni]MCU7547882.1 Hsp20/alpha crystallin family protein [Paraflavisolibacter caeni]
MTTAIAKRQNDTPSVTFGNVVDNIFQNSLRRFFDDNFWNVEGQLTTGTVPVNVRETDHQYEMDVIVPGCKKEDFNISINDNLLTISFNTKSENNSSQKAGWVHNEYVQRSFSRSFTLDDTVDVNKINATYTDGILHLTLAKNEKTKRLSKNIEIK